MKVFNFFRKIRQFANEHPATNRTFLAFSFFSALLFASPLINVALQLKPEIKDFSKHIISNAALSDLDISARVGNYYNIFLALVFITVLVYGVLYYRFRNATEKLDNTLVVKKIYNASLIGIACVATSFLFITINFATFFVFLFCLFLLLSLNRKKAGWDYHIAIWALLVSFSFVNIVYLFFDRKNFYEKFTTGITIERILLPIDWRIIFLFAVYFIFSAAFYFFAVWALRNIKKERAALYRNALLLACLPLMFITIAESLLLEFFNILNVRYGYVFNNPLRLYIIIAALALVISFVLFQKFKRRERYAALGYNAIERYYYPLMIVNMGMVITQPWRMISPENEFFEAANHGLSVDHFFRYGSIPIVETFDAHMLSNEIMGFLYGFLNGYEPWSPLLYGSYLTIGSYLIIYHLFRKALNPMVAFLLIIAMPLISLLDNHFVFAGIMALAIIIFVRKQTIRSAYFFWMAALFLCFYKLDIGFASVFAGLGTYFIVTYAAQKSVDFKKVLIPGVVSFGSFLGLFVILCLVKGINPIHRFYEFLVAGMSNQNWAIEGMGDVNLTIFRIAYYILPLIAFVLLGRTLLKLTIDFAFIQKLRQSAKMQDVLVLFLFFALFFFFNIPRGIVRHTLAFGNIIQITSTIPFAILMYLILFKKNNRLAAFLFVFISTYIVINLTTPTLVNKEVGAISQAFGSMPFKEKFTDAVDFRGTRLRETYDTSELRLFKGILDKILKPDETYFDFSSKNYYHALVGRKNPLYLNQTPIMINGDAGQLIALEQLRQVNAPLVLMPIKGNIWSDIDGVNVDYKYYLISEYIYRNYSPIMRMASFDIYALNSKKAEYLNQMKKGQTGNNIEITDFSVLQKPSTAYNNATVTADTDGKFVITTNGTTPFFAGLIAGLKAENKIVVAPNEESPTNLKFNITPGSVGSVKIYYSLKEGDPYSETNAKQFIITSLEPQDLQLDLTKIPNEVMIAVNTTSIKMNALKITKGTQPVPSKPLAQEYFLAEIPRVWAEKSGDYSFSKVSKLANPINESALTISRSQTKNDKKPFYFYVETTSINDIGAKIVLVDGNENKAIYYFNIKAGTHQYAIRLSTNYYWWHASKEAKVYFATDAPTEISKLSLIADNGKEEVQFKDSNLSLSNLTDEFWSGGVSTKLNLLLMDYSPKKESLLKGAKKITFADGRSISIKNYTVVGNYIHIAPNENVADFKAIAAYPNTIVISK